MPDSSSEQKRKQDDYTRRAITDAFSKAESIGAGQPLWKERAQQAFEGGLDALLGLFGIHPAGETTAGNLGELVSAGVPLLGAIKASQAAKAAAAAKPARSIRAYHGSPHEFERFDPSKIGTGEGAAAYGHGLYFAESPKTAQIYREQLSTPSLHVGEAEIGLPQWKADLEPEARVYRRLFDKRSKMGPQAADEDIISEVRKDVEADRANARRYGDAAEIEHTSTQLATLDEAQARGIRTRPGGHGYEVAIKADPEQFLDWDKPLSEQSESVRRGLANLGIKDEKSAAKSAYLDAIRRAAKTPEDAQKATIIANEIIDGTRPATGNYAHQHWQALERYAPGVDHNAIHDIRSMSGGTGADVYEQVRFGQSRYGVPNSYEAASEALRFEGIPGIRYLDQLSRAAGEGTRNYVVFPGSESLIDILRKYGLIGAAGAGALGQQLRVQQER